MGLERVMSVAVGEGGGTEIGGSIEFRHFTQSIDLPSVALDSIADFGVAFTGLLIGDIPIQFVMPEAQNPNLQVIALGPVVTNNNLQVRVENESGVAVDEVARTYHLVVMRP